MYRLHNITSINTCSLIFLNLYRNKSHKMKLLLQARYCLYKWCIIDYSSSEAYEMLFLNKVYFNYFYNSYEEPEAILYMLNLRIWNFYIPEWIEW